MYSEVFNGRNPQGDLRLLAALRGGKRRARPRRASAAPVVEGKPALVLAGCEAVEVEVKSGCRARVATPLRLVGCWS